MHSVAWQRKRCRYRDNVNLQFTHSEWLRRNKVHALPSQRELTSEKDSVPTLETDQRRNARMCEIPASGLLKSLQNAILRYMFRLLLGVLCWLHALLVPTGVSYISSENLLQSCLVHTKKIVPIHPPEHSRSILAKAEKRFTDLHYWFAHLEQSTVRLVCALFKLLTRAIGLLLLTVLLLMVGYIFTVEYIMSPVLPNVFL
uniref:Uncharacterized protein n=1 Tax=Anopheles albimanus TaxID=7167 RepID=A0A8W7K7T6_ANOAL